MVLSDWFGIAATIISASSALAGVLIANWWNEKLLDKERRQKLLDPVNFKRVEALDATYRKMAEVRFILNMYANSPYLLSSQSDYRREVGIKLEEWKKLEQQNVIWLANIQKEISNVRGIFREVARAIYDDVLKKTSSVTLTADQWRKLWDDVSITAGAIRREIGLETLEDDIKKLLDLGDQKELSKILGSD